jgi:hypothetical protein
LVEEVLNFFVHLVRHLGCSLDKNQHSWDW